ncbi:MAG TPA: hypothetical protein VN258_12725 [Mobilitalea sp.]|nr:hypothetical protein [Mobilitalea sp.]
MGSRVVSFSFTPGENEQIETVIVIPEEHRSIIHGIVKNQCHKEIKDAVVKLYECVEHHEEHNLKPLTHTFTDECGQFVFGPLWPCKSYVIKVWINDVKVRELVIQPEESGCPKETYDPPKPPFPGDQKDSSEKEDPIEKNDFFLKSDHSVKMQPVNPFFNRNDNEEDYIEEVDTDKKMEASDDLDE